MKYYGINEQAVRRAARCMGRRSLTNRYDDVAILRLQHRTCSEPNCIGYHYEKLNEKGQACAYALRMEDFPPADHSDADAMKRRVEKAITNRPKELGLRALTKRGRKRLNYPLAFIGTQTELL